MSIPVGIGFVLFAAISLLTAAAAMLAASRLAPVLWRQEPRLSRSRAALVDVARRYEFRDGYLLSPLDPDDAFLSPETDRAAALDVLGFALTHLHAELPGALRHLHRRGEPFLLIGTMGQDALSVSGRREEDRLIVQIAPTETHRGREIVESAGLAALKAEAANLREAIDAAPVAMWREDEGPDGEPGTIRWANHAYLSLLEQSGEGDIGWPLKPLFADQLIPPPGAGSTRRCRLSVAQGEDTTVDGWFDVSVQRCADGATLWAARPIDQLVETEGSLRRFVQTLSKTFAHLPIGLAVFDRRRKLVMFNPALLGQSSLEADFLSQRPSLVSFLDRLRERQRMPEPRNYRAWREDIARLEEGAEAGTYHELWTLPGGDSLRVIGRPHPDGAIAFMFEDVSQAITLTRQFRQEIDQFKAALATSEGALGLFGAEGDVIFLNAAAQSGLGAQSDGEEPAQTVQANTIEAATDLWQASFAPTGFWGDLRDFVRHRSARAGWEDHLTTKDGAKVRAVVAPLPGGAAMLRFTIAVETDAKTDAKTDAEMVTEGVPAPHVVAAPQRAMAVGFAEPLARFEAAPHGGPRADALPDTKNRVGKW